MKRYFPKNFLLCFSLTAGFMTAVSTLHAEENNDRGFFGKEFRFFQDTAGIYAGVLVDDYGMPVAGAQVKTGAAPAVITNDRGMFTLQARRGEVVAVSLNDIEITRFTLTGDVEPRVQIQGGNPAWKLAQDVRLVYNLSTKRHLTATSTQAVYNHDIQKMPVTSAKSAVVGRLAGLYTNQISGRPGQDEVNLNLRGAGSPLVLVDGIPRNITVFDLAEIESVTLLKDALSTAMLGVRGSNGAFLITTKKGVRAKQQISFTAQTALQERLGEPKALGAYDYATLFNEAYRNEMKFKDPSDPARQRIPYSQIDLQGYQTGSDPFKYPNVDWRREILRKNARFDRYTLEAQGGSNTARYFVAAEHFNQTGIFKTVDTNNYNTNNSLKSYVIRSNVDINITSKLTAGIYLLGRILTGGGPGNFGTAGIMDRLLLTPNNAYPVLNPNGSFAGTPAYTTNLWALTVGSGYTQNYNRDMLSDIYLKRTLDEVTKGLWAKATVSYYSNLSELVNRSKSVYVYQRQLDTITGVVSHRQLGSQTNQSNAPGIEYQNRTSYMELAFGYNRTFGDHGVDATILGNRDNIVSNSELPLSYTGTSGRAAYNYKEKYVLEAAWGLNGTNRYPENASTRLGFFPAAGLAWNMHKEDFLRNRKWISHLKVYGSFGKTGWNAPTSFDYILRYPDAFYPYFGSNTGTAQTSVMQGDVVNTSRTFEQARKLNVGITGSLFGDRLFFTAEHFRNKFYDLLQPRGRSNALLGSSFPLENIGSNRYTGYDLQLAFKNNVRKFEYFISGNAGISDSRVLFADEVPQPYSWMTRTGHRVGQPFGYRALGLFQSDAEALASAKPEGYVAQAGDIKYWDRNNDGVINQFDQMPIGNQKPVITYGVDLGFNFRGFDFSALFHGVHNRQIYLGGIAYWAFQSFGTGVGTGYGQAYVHNLDRWTPTNTDATYPRLSLGSNLNNQAFSSYWYRSGNFLRLKNVVLGYTLPHSLTRRVRVQSVRVFVTGTNLYTFSSLKDGMDPEVYGGAYPIQRLTNIGINIKL